MLPHKPPTYPNSKRQQHRPEADRQARRVDRETSRRPPIDPAPHRGEYLPAEADDEEEGALEKLVYERDHV